MTIGLALAGFLALFVWGGFLSSGIYMVVIGLEDHEGFPVFFGVFLILLCLTVAAMAFGI